MGGGRGKSTGGRSAAKRKADAKKAAKKAATSPNTSNSTKSPSKQMGRSYAKKRADAAKKAKDAAKAVSSVKHSPSSISKNFSLGPGFSTKPNEHGGRWGFASNLGKDPNTGKNYTAQTIHKKLSDAASQSAASKAKNLGVLTPGGIKNPDFVPAPVKSIATKLGLKIGESISDFSQTDWAQKQLTKLDENPDSWQNRLLTSAVDKATEGAREYAREQPGISGLIGGWKAGSLERHLRRNDLTRAFDTIDSTFSLVDRYKGIPTFGQIAMEPVNWARDKLNPNQEAASNPLSSLPSSIRNVFTGDNGRDLIQRMAERTRTGGGKMTIRDVDPNKIGNQTANPYLTSGQAAQDESRLREFWIEQDRLNRAAEEKLRNIQTDRSTYNTLLTDLGDASTAYTDELARIQPYGKQYSDELARIQPYGKQYSDEIARLQPFDKEFTSSIAELTKGRDELKGYRGQWTHPDDIKFLDENIPAYDKAIADLENQYKSYQTSVAELTKGQKDYQSYLGELQTGQKDYQSYLGTLQTGQKQLSDYTLEVDRKRGELEDYATAFTAAREQSARDARSYTIRSQQGISSGLRSGISGVRARGGLTTIGRDTSKSPKKRFNRDFRIGSFGDTSMSPINI